MHDEARSHQATWALLPWLANGSATPEQRRAAEAHLRQCAHCRAELAREQQLALAVQLAPAAVPASEPGLQRLMQRIELDDAAPSRSKAWPVASGRRMSLRSVALLALAEGLLLAALGWWWSAPGRAAADEAPYRTLTQREPASADGPRWRVVFQPGTTVGDLQALLLAQGLVIVDGPSPAGVFTLGPAERAAAAAAPDADAVAAQLRRLPGVLFAEARVRAGTP